MASRDSEPMNARVERILGELAARARSALDNDLRSMVLFGSAAEGRLRATSDVNVIIVLERYTPERIDELREALRMARATVRLEPMFVLASEVSAVAEAFAVKFGDVARRRRVLFGEDPFAGLAVDPEALRRRVQQVLLNLVLRLRRTYALDGARDDVLVRAVADSAGPLRAAAAAVLELEGVRTTSGREALGQLVARWQDADGPVLLDTISSARERAVLPPGTAGPAVLRIIDLAERLRSAGEPPRRVSDRREDA